MIYFERFIIWILIWELIVLLKEIVLWPKTPKSRIEYDREMARIEECIRWRKNPNSYCCIAYTKYDRK